MSKRKNADDQRQFWQMVFETFSKSGLSVRQFCKKEGLNESGFYYWKKKLQASSYKSQNCDDDLPVESERKNSPDFIRVSLPQSTRNDDVELALASGSILKFGCHIDKSALGKIVSVLHEQGLC